MNENLYTKCNFSDSHLKAIQTIYNTHFEPKMPKYYQGTGIAAFWGKNDIYPKQKDVIFDPNGSVKGFVLEQVEKDPLWDIFYELLPYMKSSATITKMPSNSMMQPHIDRPWRPNAIYFPIENCTPDCVSSYYENGKEIASYAVCENAYLTNVHKMHGVKNNSNKTRIAFGWNFKNPNFSFSDCKSILKGLGYIKD